MLYHMEAPENQLLRKRRGTSDRNQNSRNWRFMASRL